MKVTLNSCWCLFWDFFQAPGGQKNISSFFISQKCGEVNWFYLLLTCFCCHTFQRVSDLLHFNVVAFRTLHLIQNCPSPCLSQRRHPARMTNLHPDPSLLLGGVSSGTSKTTSFPPLQTTSLSPRHPRVRSGLPPCLLLIKIPRGPRPVEGCPRSAIAPYPEGSARVTF